MMNATRSLPAPLQRKSKSYEGLLEAAGFLKSQRLHRISETTSRELARQFHIAAGGDQEGRPRLRGTGELIVSDVCDVKDGISEAVNSLVSRLTDPQRFSGPWIAEVIKVTELLETLRRS